MLNCSTILEELPVWKGNGPIHACEPEINCHKSSTIDCKTKSLRKMQNCQTTSWSQLGWKWNSVAHKQSRTGFWCPWFIKLISETLPLMKQKNPRRSFLLFCCKQTEEDFYRSEFTCESTCEFVRYCSFLNPVFLNSCEQKSCQKHFKLPFKELMKLNILSASQCDPAVMDFSSFCSNEF